MDSAHWGQSLTHNSVHSMEVERISPLGFPTYCRRSSSPVVSGGVGDGEAA